MLITHGLRLDQLGSRELSWRDLLVIVRRSPMTSALSRELLGDIVAWSLTEHMLAQVVDNTNWLVWAKTEDGAKGRNRPKRLLRPGDKPDDDETHHGSDPMSLEAMQEWLGWQTPAATDPTDETEAT